MKTVIAILLCQLCFSPLFSQQFYLRGEIRDEAGHLLQNANITLKSTGYLYKTGTYGSFGIVTREMNDSLLVSLDGFESQRLSVKANEYVNIQLKSKPVAASTSFRTRLSSMTSGLARESQKEWFLGDETYASLVENHFINAQRNPETGLALNIDRASYSNVRRFVNMNTLVPPDAVRIEEMLNYFNSDYHEPANGQVFSAKSTLTDCPWSPGNQLFYLNVASKKLNLDTLPASNLVFLIDISGSMDMPNRLPLLQSAFRMLTENLRAKDSVSIVVYGGTVGVLLDALGGDQKDSIMRVVSEITPGGSTPGESGIKLAYSVARNHFIRGGNNRVILATDGDFNVGLRTDDDLETLIATQKESGIYLTCIGVGMGNYKDSKIQALARKGNGNFAYFDNFMEAEKVLLKEYTQTLYSVADDVYLQVKFNPDLVKEYRLIGFDNKMGAIKDSDSFIEGGEIGSGRSTLAVFEIVPVQPLKDSLPKESTQNFASIDISYVLPNSSQPRNYTSDQHYKYVPFGKLAKPLRFATAVVMFGSLLKESPFIRQASFPQVEALALDSYDPEDRAQQDFISLVDQTKSLYAKLKKKKRKDKDGEVSRL